MTAATYHSTDLPLHRNLAPNVPVIVGPNAAEAVAYQLELVVGLSLCAHIDYPHPCVSGQRVGFRVGSLMIHDLWDLDPSRLVVQPLHVDQHCQFCQGFKVQVWKNIVKEVGKNSASGYSWLGRLGSIQPTPG